MCAQIVYYWAEFHADYEFAKRNLKKVLQEWFRIIRVQLSPRISGGDRSQAKIFEFW